MKHRKRGKLLYVPGMISLFVFPLLCLWFFYSREVFVEYRCMTIAFPDQEFLQQLKNESGFPIPRKYKEYVLSGSDVKKKTIIRIIATFIG